jgi:GNAT superfamily N-acetyltransferase
MDLIETNNIEIKDPEIRERDLESSRSNYTHHYIAMEDGKEVGLLSVDFGNEWEKHFIIYELFVPPALRKSGYGNGILNAAETLAIDCGYQSTLLVARSMDKKWFKQKKLEAWYRRHGYEISTEHANSPFVKLLSAE